ncbi:Trans-2-enoyl-CoA reductase, mitochondrial [Smittium mucronatum]|uniref:Trans-2-enoyl-CoA reductase, mitochondrial n=1 Tax=Smittium mucronatum TaxID=133383 RepID=A0A1R0H2L8_9FUNG|nr:Trans-2-enoyl-CoA reductase, mitochondrial [Smittium mucronatum]
MSDTGFISATSIVMSSHGEPSEVLRGHELVFESVPEDCVLVEMILASVNPSDKSRIRGVYPTSIPDRDFKLASDPSQDVTGTLAGNEGVGKVTKLGSAQVTDINNVQISEGDWVIPFDFGSLGAWSSKLVIKAKSVVVIKNTEGLTADDCCSIKVNAATSYRMLLDIVTLNKGDYVIQNGANSGAGQYLIQLAHLWGFKTINVIRDRANYQETVDYLTSLGADIVVKDSELGTPEVDEQLKNLDGPIRLAINCIGGENAQKMARYLEANGTFSTYGAMTLDPIVVSAPSFIFKNLTYKGYWLGLFYKNNPVSVWIKTWYDILELMRQGKLVAQKSRHLDVSANLNAELLQDTVFNALNSSEKVAIQF